MQLKIILCNKNVIGIWNNSKIIVYSSTLRAIAFKNINLSVNEQMDECVVGRFYLQKNIDIHIKINESLRVVHFLAQEGKTYKIKQ